MLLLLLLLLLLLTDSNNNNQGCNVSRKITFCFEAFFFAGWVFSAALRPYMICFDALYKLLFYYSILLTSSHQALMPFFFYVVKTWNVKTGNIKPHMLELILTLTLFFGLILSF